MTSSCRTKLPFLLLIFIKLTLVAGLPMTALAGAGYDDALFVRGGIQLASGRWLGNYDLLTLIKGPGYPLFMALAYHVGLPVSLAQHLLYILFCVVFVIAVRPAVGYWGRVFLFAVLLFNPDSFTTGSMSRFIREGIYPALSGLTIALALGMTLRSREPVASLRRWAAALGITFAMFWLTREEGIWIVPSLVVLLGCGLISVIRAWPKDWLPRLFAFLVIPAALSVGLVCMVACINRIWYGEFVTVELHDPAFVAAYGALTRVKPAVFLRRVPVSKETRQRIYAVSPSFRELQPYLEGEMGRTWESYSAAVYPARRGEITGGWFMWALRDAVSRAGYTRDAKMAHRYYARLAREVNNACNAGKLPADSRRDSLVPRWRSEYLMPTWRAARMGALMMAGFGDIGTELASSSGTPTALRKFSRFIDSATTDPVGDSLDSRLNRITTRQLKSIGRIVWFYQAIGRTWTVLSLMTFLILCGMTFAGFRSQLLLAGASLLVGIIVYLTLLSYINATSFPAINAVYFSSDYALLLAFNGLMTVGAARVTASRFRTADRQNLPAANKGALT